MRGRLVARSCSALVLGLAVGCFQPLEPFEDADDNPHASPDASPPAATGATAPKPAAARGDAGADARPAAAPGAGAAPPPATGAAGPGVTATQPGVLPPQPGGALPTPPGPSVDACTLQPHATCTSMPGCARVDAYAIHPMLGCATGEIRPSCMKSEIGCTLLFGNVVVQGANGQTYRVPFSCVPPDLKPLAPQPMFPRVGTCPTPEVEAACEAHRDLEACTGDPYWECMPKSAGRFDRTQGCITLPEGPGRFLGCTSSHYQPEPVRLFRDPQGEIWEVSGASLDGVPGTWMPIAASSVIPDAGTDLPHCFSVGP